MLSEGAGIAYTQCMQYTVRNIPEQLDQELRRLARQEGRSLNDIALQAMARGIGYAPQPARHRDLSGIAGSWKEDPEFEAAVADQDAIDPGLWSA